MLGKVFNPEGYATRINSTSLLPDYHYYRKDHLGNNREVWRAAYKDYRGTIVPLPLYNVFSTTQAVCLGQKEQEETFKTVNTTVKSSLKCMVMIHTIMWLGACIRRL